MHTVTVPLRKSVVPVLAVLGLTLAACGGDVDPVTAPLPGGSPDGTTSTSEAQAAAEARAIVGDVVDFALTSDEWPGAFGFVTMRLREGAFDGNDVYFVRTDASDESFAQAEELVYVPKLASLTGEGLSGAAYVVEDASDDQPTVFSTEPGRDDYTPAWSLHRVTWSGEPRVVRSEAEILDAERSGDLTIERTNIVFNGGMVKWSSGEMAVDDERTDYLGKGQLLDPSTPRRSRPRSSSASASRPAATSCWTTRWNRWPT